MKVDVSKLKTISNYAKKHGCSATWVHKLIKKGELPLIKVDGVLFILT